MQSTMRNQAKRNRGYGLWVHIAAAAISVVLGLSSSYAQEGPFSNAESAIKAATQMLDKDGVEATDDKVLRDIRDILDAITEDFPASDIAVKILFQDTIDGLDVAALDRRLLEVNGFVADSEVTNPSVDTGPTNLDVETAIADDSVAGENETAKSDEDPSIDEGTAEPAISETLNEAQIVQPVFTAARFNPSLFSTDVMEMAEELHYCYIRGSLEGGSEKLAILFTVADSGQLDGDTKVKNGADLTGSAQRTYQNALIAIKNCGPYPQRFSDRRYEAEFDGLGLTGLAFVNTVETQWAPASKASFAALKLDRKAIAEIQARLDANGFDPNGVDGIMGKGSRSAVSAWQLSQRIPATGYLDMRQLEKLNEVTGAGFALWLQNAKNKAMLEKASRPPPKATPRRTTRTTTRRSSSRGWYRNNRGLYCRRLAIGTWCQAARPRKRRR
jgi:hypothetical protein